VFFPRALGSPIKASQAAAPRARFATHRWPRAPRLVAQHAPGSRAAGRPRLSGGRRAHGGRASQVDQALEQRGHAAAVARRRLQPAQAARGGQLARARGRRRGQAARTPAGKAAARAPAGKAAARAGPAAAPGSERAPSARRSCEYTRQPPGAATRRRAAAAAATTAAEARDRDFW
jgi:hypothetical protein